MTTLFFLLTMFFILYEVYALFSTRKFYEFKKAIAAKPDKNKSDGCLLISLVIPYIIWCVLGVALSDQWLSFLVLIGVGVVTSIISSLLKIADLSDGKLKLLLIKIDALISIILLVDIFMVHFRGDVYTSITGFLF